MSLAHPNPRGNCKSLRGFGAVSPFLRRGFRLLEALPNCFEPLKTARFLGCECAVCFLFTQRAQLLVETAFDLLALGFPLFDRHRLAAFYKTLAYLFDLRFAFGRRKLLQLLAAALQFFTYLPKSL